MPVPGNSRQKTLTLTGALCGGVVGYLSAQWIVGGAYLLLFLLCGGDSMKDTRAFVASLVALYALVVALFAAMGAGLGIGIGKRVDSNPKLALACGLFCAFTALVWLVHKTPAQAERHKLDAMRARYYDTDGYKKVSGTELRPRKDGTGLDLAVKLVGRRGGNYFLYCSVSHSFSIPGGSSGVISNIFSEKRSLSLAPGEFETTLTIPARAVAMKYAEELRRFRDDPADLTTLEVHVEADLPADSEYYGSQWQLLERKSIPLTLKDLGIVTTAPSSPARR